MWSAGHENWATTIKTEILSRNPEYVASTSLLAWHREHERRSSRNPYKPTESKVVRTSFPVDESISEQQRTRRPPLATVHRWFVEKCWRLLHMDSGRAERSGGVKNAPPIHLGLPVNTAHLLQRRFCSKHFENTNCCRVLTSSFAVVGAGFAGLVWRSNLNVYLRSILLGWKT